MNRIVRRVAVLGALLATPAAITVATAASPASAAVSATTITTYENQVVTLVNQQRAAGCVALRNDSLLHSAARAHSVDMATHNYFDHTGTDGSTFVTRVQATGYSGSTVGENIAWGWGTPSSVVNAWMNSAPHKANILNCSFHATGVGLAYASNGTAYWTQEFGSK